MRAEQLFVTVTGHKLEVDAIKLHPEADVRAWQEKLGEAQEQLGGFSTGIGVLGSPGVAIASAAAIGIFEAAVSSSKEKKGLRLLGEAAEMLSRLREQGEFVSVAEIEGTTSPLPADWSVKRLGKVVTDLSSYGAFERMKIVEKHKVTFGESMSGSFEREGMVPAFVVLPDEFVWIRTQHGDVAVRWSGVECYSFTTIRGEAHVVTE